MPAAPQRVMDIIQRHLRCHNIVSCRVHPCTRLGAVFSDFPLAFVKHLEPSRVDNQVGNLPFRWLPIRHLHRASPIILGRAGSRDDRGIDQRALLHHDAGFTKAMSQLRVAWGAPAPHANTL
jgi:hypothetical protein